MIRCLKEGRSKQNFDDAHAALSRKYKQVPEGKVG
jgi:hypothetical protein